MQSSRVIAIALSVLAQPSLAQSSSGIELLTTRHVSIDNARRPHVETYIAVHPRNPRHLLATAIVSENGKIRSLPYVSEDGGQTWTRGRVIGDTTIISDDTADPVIYFAPTGDPYFSTLGTNRTFVA